MKVFMERFPNDPRREEIALLRMDVENNWLDVPASRGLGNSHAVEETEQAVADSFWLYLEEQRVREARFAPGFSGSHHTAEPLVVFDRHALEDLFDRAETGKKKAASSDLPGSVESWRERFVNHLAEPMAEDPNTGIEISISVTSDTVVETVVPIWQKYTGIS
jgi:hypothetical protein